MRERPPLASPMIAAMLVSGCLGRSDLRVPIKSLGEECVANAECPEACIGGVCAQYASGGDACDEPADCLTGADCMAGICAAANATCGNGMQEAGEDCDDGNTSPGDGCTPTCTVQAGWFCDTREPSRCALESMEVINAGTFTMGSPGTELGREADEIQHDVTFTRDFSLWSTEVTQAQFQAVMSNWNPSIFGPCADCPVDNVNWYDAVAFANALTLQQGGTPCYVLSDVVCVDTTNVGSNYTSCMNATQSGINSAAVGLNGVTSVYGCTSFRLPTEAEWEYAARAGDQRATYNGDSDAGHLVCEQPNPVLDSIAWFCGNSGSVSHTTGGLLPNAWGLYDILGNLWEWCWDWYGSAGAGTVTDPEGPATGSFRVGRGGCFECEAWSHRAGDRDWGDPASRNSRRGLRVARSIP